MSATGQTISSLFAKVFVVYNCTSLYNMRLNNDLP